MKKLDYSWTLFLLFNFIFLDSAFCLYPKHPITEYCSTIEPIPSFLRSLVEILTDEYGSEDTELQLNTLISIRYYLERNDNCPDDEMLKNELVSILVKCFDLESSEIHKEAANSLGLFANGTEAQANLIIKYNAIPHLLNFLSSSDNEEIQKQALFALMTIMGHGPKFRDYCIKAGLIQPLIDMVENSENSIDLFYDLAVMMYYVCQEGRPIIPYETVVQILPAIKTLIELKSDDEKMDGILISAIGSLGFIGRSGFKRIPAIVNQNFVEKIVPFLRHPHKDVQKMTMFALNKIMDGNDTYHQHVLDHGVLKHLHILLDHPTDTSVIGEAMEFLIHTIAPNKTHVKEVFAEETNLMLLVIKAFDIPKKIIQIRATEVIIVTSVQGTEEQVEYLIENGVATGICKHMKIVNFERYEGEAENVLDALSHLIKKGKAKMAIVFDEMDKCGGMDILEKLQKSSNFNIRFMAGNIVNSILSAVQKIHMEL